MARGLALFRDKMNGPFVTIPGDEPDVESNLRRANGPDLSPEMMVAALPTGQTVIGIPVEHHPRAAFRTLRTALSHRLGWR